MIAVRKNVVFLCFNLASFSSVTVSNLGLGNARGFLMVRSIQFSPTGSEIEVSMEFGSFDFS